MVLAAKYVIELSLKRNQGFINDRRRINNRFISQTRRKRSIWLPRRSYYANLRCLVWRTIKHYLTRHEQGAGFAAVGFARSTGKLGVCFATSGPGATNLITALADAMMDSVPLLAITGQVPTAAIGSDAFQEIDVLGMSLSCTKHSYMVERAEDLAEILQEAMHLAQSGRPGPVLVDIPKDIQMAQVPFQPWLAADEYLPELDLKQVAIANQLLSEAKQPVALCRWWSAISRMHKPS